MALLDLDEQQSPPKKNAVGNMKLDHQRVSRAQLLYFLVLSNSTGIIRK